MRTTSTRLAAVAVGALMLVAVACGSSKDETKTSDTSGGSTETTLSEGKALLADATLIKDGQITVCSDIPYTPFEFEDDAGKTTGFDVDLVEKMGAELGVTVTFQTTPFDSIIAAVSAGNCDMIASAMTITDERAQQINFTEGYFDADQSLLIRAEDKGTYAKLTDLAGKKIGVQSGTTGEEYAKANLPDGAELVAFESGDQIFAALTSKQIDAGLQDFPVNAYRALKDPTLAVTETFPTQEQYGFGVAKANTNLVKALDAELAALKADGTYDEIYATWFGTTK